MSKNQRENFQNKAKYLILTLFLISLIITIKKYPPLQSNYDFKDKSLFQTAKIFFKTYPEYNPVLSRKANQNALSKIKESGVITFITQNN